MYLDHTTRTSICTIALISGTVLALADVSEIGASPGEVKKLIEDAKDTSNEQRAFDAMATLAKMRFDAAPAIAAELTAADSFRFAYILGKMGKSGLPSLLNALKSPDNKVRRRVVIALGYTGPIWTENLLDESPNTIPYLLDSLKDSDAGVVSLSAQGLCAHRARDAYPALKELIHGPTTDLGLQRILESCLFDLGAPPDTTLENPNTIPKNGDEWHIEAKSSNSRQAVHYAMRLEQKEITSERAACRHVEINAVIGAQMFFLGRLYVPTGSSADSDLRPEGIDRESIELGFVVPSRVLRISWSTIKNARFDVPADSTVLLLLDGNRWHELFRSTVPGYSGYLRDSTAAALRFFYNQDTGSIRLESTWNYFADDLTVNEGQGPPLLSARYVREGRVEYRIRYSFVRAYGCRFENNKLQIGSGVGCVDLFEGEFPVGDVVKFLNREGDVETRPVTAEALVKMNPALRGERLCTGKIVYSENIPPYQPNGNHYYLWSSHL